jgi:CDP-diacylglycerol---serine O-phosphatidyltransferase
LNIKAQIPNTITLCNLLCGCLGLVEVLQNGSIIGACILMTIALVCDFFDGFLARLLKVSSPIGRELDSLADVVTFGVLPAAILSYVMEHHAGVTSNLKYFPFLIAMFSALRLAKFNIDTRQSDSFIGLNTPANSILIASVALNLENFSTDFFTTSFQNQYFIIGFVLLSSFLLIAELPMFAFKFKNFAFKSNEIRFGFILMAFILISIFKLVAIPWIIILYILVSVLNNRFSQKKIDSNL